MSANRKREWVQLKGLKTYVDAQQGKARTEFKEWKATLACYFAVKKKQSWQTWSPNQWYWHRCFIKLTQNYSIMAPNNWKVVCISFCAEYSWTKGCTLYPIYKKGHHTIFVNYSRISLHNIAYKVLPSELCKRKESKHTIISVDFKAAFEELHQCCKTNDLQSCLWSQSIPIITPGWKSNQTQNQKRKSSPTEERSNCTKRSSFKAEEDHHFVGRIRWVKTSFYLVSSMDIERLKEGKTVVLWKGRLKSLQPWLRQSWTFLFAATINSVSSKKFNTPAD